MSPQQICQVQIPYFLSTNFPEDSQQVFMFCAGHKKSYCGQILKEDRPAGLALFGGRALAHELPIVHAVRIPVPCSLVELAGISRNLWPNGLLPTAIRVNQCEVEHNHDMSLRFPLIQPVSRQSLPHTATNVPPLPPLCTVEVLARLPGMGRDAASLLTSTSTTTVAFHRGSCSWHPGDGQVPVTFFLMDETGKAFAVACSAQDDLHAVLHALQRQANANGADDIACTFVAYPRVFLGPDGDPCIFACLQPARIVNDLDIWVWIDARPWLPTPIAAFIPALCKPADLRRLFPGLPENWVVTCGALPLKDTVHFLGPGSVIQIRPNCHAAFSWPLNAVRTRFPCIQGLAFRWSVTRHSFASQLSDRLQHVADLLGPVSGEAGVVIVGRTCTPYAVQ